MGQVQGINPAVESLETVCQKLKPSTHYLQIFTAETIKIFKKIGLFTY